MRMSAMDLICQSLKEIVHVNLADCLDIEHSHALTIPLKLKQKTKDLKSGDIVLPWFVRTDEHKARKFLQNTEEGLRKTGFPIKNVLQDKHNILSFHLDRPSVTRDVLKQVHEKGTYYGHSEREQACYIMLHSFLEGYEDGYMTKSPLHMRMFYVRGHLKRLLKACGHQIVISERSHCNGSVPESQEVGNASLSNGHSYPEENFISSVKSLSNEQKDNGVVDNGEISLKSVVQQENFYTGKDGLDKNLNKVEVFSPDGKEASEIVKETAMFDVTITMNDSPCNVIHIVPQGRVFRLQQMILLHAGVSNKKITQSQLTMGPVMCKGDITMDQFQRSRFEQMKEASEMRHGIKCEGREWEFRINQLSQSGIKMEVLGTALHCPLKMDLQSTHSAENRLGAFVLYNTARLATLLRQFNLGVENGTYPPLPSIADVNFSLLREQEEWELLFLYVATFPNTVKESVEVIFPEGGKLAAKIHTHRITNFLISFSKSLSSYYSRYHILGGPESHLLPLMFARLHLVQACHQVMCNGLQLLDIQPLEEL